MAAFIPNSRDSDRLCSVAQLAKALSDENRLRILYCLSAGRQSVSALTEQLELSQPLVSHHLRELKRTLLVQTERQGPFVYYRLADEAVLALLATMDDLATTLLKRKTHL